MRYVWGILLVAVLGITGYTMLMLNWSYSDGERVGVVQKLSRKGWLCKTSEGELAMYVVGGIAPQIWSFTVHDKAVLGQLNDALGKRVRVHYDEHRGLWSSCFGDTPYFVNAVTVLDGSAPEVAGSPPATR